MSLLVPAHHIKVWLGLIYPLIGVVWYSPQSNPIGDGKCDRNKRTQDTFDIKNELSVRENICMQNMVGPTGLLSV